MQRWPAAPNAEETTTSAAKAILVSGMMTKWFLPLPKACTRLLWATPWVRMCRATGLEPTKVMAATSGCSMIRSTDAGSPRTTLNTPSGRPARVNNSATRSKADGFRSLGLATTVFPQAIAIMLCNIGIMLES